MDKDVLKLANKKRLTIVGKDDDFSKIYNALAAVNIHAAEAFRDAVWHKDGKWHGVGIGNIPPKDVIDYVLELERMAEAGEQFPLCNYKSIEKGD